MVFGKKGKEQEEYIVREDERVELKSVEELIDTVQVMSSQLDIIYGKVSERDEIVEKLEDEVRNNCITIESLANDISGYENELKDKMKEIEKLKEIIAEKEEVIAKKDLKIKRLEEEVQSEYDENDKLKEEIKAVNNANRELNDKLNGIGKYFK